MCKVIAIVNQKGGVAKTTTTVNLGIGLVREGKKVLLIDADSQGSLSSSLGVAEPDELDVTLSTIMCKMINDEDYGKREGIIVHEEGVSFLPCNIELSGLEVTLVNTMRREYILKEYITSVRNLYDYILIDCNSSLGMVTMNALTAADSVIIPIEAAYLSIKGLQQLITTLGRTKKYLNPNLGYRGNRFHKDGWTYQLRKGNQGYGGRNLWQKCPCVWFGYPSFRESVRDFRRGREYIQA